MKQQFKQGFSEYASAGDTIETTIGKFIVVAQIVHDDITTQERIDADEYYSQDMTGCTDEQQAEIERVRDAWYANEWFYCGIQLSVYYENEHGPRVELDEHAESLWGLECNYPDSNNSHLNEAVNEMLPEALEQGRIALDSLRNVINN